MTKPPKTPRPPKPPIYPSDPNEVADPGIGITLEKLIGRAVVEWAKLEACMGGAIGKLFGIEFEYARIVTSRMDATGLLRTLREVGKLRLNEIDFHELSTICDKIDILRETRNLIVHGTWGRTASVGTNWTSGAVAVSLSLRIKGDSSEVIAESFSHSRMQKIISDIQSLKWDLIALLKLSEQPDIGFGPPLVE